ncbi:hypothetical protein GLAREA_03277 [Glarea lozoyensis ATCC 20868]|uniref:Uncharacterized protein n=1 Tax=Glarea lozoyensis (strain ATCC 20868 / MF5171) TaxID=1116229 RepID=S3CLK6_GLAL2|nr:uncharacterized protein GLAREA_03277 [Glarea lozoyensis ATCC 20868]EPE27362.1 hypothetical protein GLAREA_03277 [Glarea lozoyensis ATCC 20868]
MEIVPRIWRDYRVYRIRHSLFVAGVFYKVEEHVLEDWNEMCTIDFTRDVPTMTRMNIEDMMFRRSLFPSQFALKACEELRKLEDCVKSLHIAVPGQNGVYKSVLPELSTFYLGGYDDMMQLHAHIDIFINEDHVDRAGAKMFVYQCALNLLDRASKSPDDKLWRIGLNHGWSCEWEHRCFWTELEVILRRMSKRLSYIDNSYVDGNEGLSHIYIHEIAEPDGTGIVVDWDAFREFGKSVADEFRDR